MSRYLIGCDVLGGETTIPTAGAKYTDYATVYAVQSALKAKGFDPGKLDGVMGPRTAAAIRSMQSAAGIPQTGIVDEGVIMALRVTPGVMPPGVSAAKAADVRAQAALDAATAAEHAITPDDVRSAADQVANAAPAQPPELKQAAAKAGAAAIAARTPAEVAAAKQQVQVVAQQVQAQAATQQGFWMRPMWAGAPVRTWQGIVGGGALAAILAGIVAAARRK